MSTYRGDFIAVVSGLPRSGTSMMMRMLEAGGLPALIDNIRMPDEDNPEGYYEFEAVKQTKRDASWLETAPGKAVKMVYRLLYDLPATHEYRVIFMRRNLDEVLASQRVMLERHGKASDDIDDARVAQMFRSQLRQFEDWVRQQPHISILDVDYNALMNDPPRHVAEINRFLGGFLDAAAMEAIVNPSLYRNRR